MSFRNAVSGLRAATADLDVTSNNIANANTHGFKESRAQFADVYAVSNLGTSQDSIGQGVAVSSISQQFNQGNVSFTDNNLDLAINGQGFFTLQDPSGGRVYSRAGAFQVDKNGFVVNSTGHNLLAFQAVGGTVTGSIGPLQFSSANISPQASTQMDIGVNLDAGAPIPVPAFNPADAQSFNNSASTTVYDSLGQEHLASVYFRHTAANQWDMHFRVNNDPAYTPAPVTLNFDQAGALTTPMPLTGPFGAYTPPTGALPFNLNFDLTGSTQFGASFGVNSLTQDGFTTGRLAGIDIDEDGVVLARFTNGQSVAQGQVVLSNFGNAQGLAAASDSTWVETSASGTPLTGAPGTASLGLLQSGALEESNVDLAAQLVNMIIAQRNFQANAQVIRAEDEVTQTIINIR